MGGLLLAGGLDLRLGKNLQKGHQQFGKNRGWGWTAVVRRLKGEPHASAIIEKPWGRHVAGRGESQNIFEHLAEPTLLRGGKQLAQLIQGKSQQHLAQFSVVGRFGAKQFDASVWQ